MGAKILCLSLVVGIQAISLIPAFAQNCRCDGESLDRFSGGNGAPLDWHFGAFRSKVGNASDQAIWICYFKSVSNKSGQETRNIRWKIANYFRSKVAAGNEDASCPTIPGEMNPDPVVGPLHYSVASHYDTTIRAPKGGWSVSNRIRAGSSWPIVRSVFELSLGAERNARIVLYSAVAVLGEKSILTYDFANEGTAPVWFLANIPTTSTLTKDVPAIDDGMLLSPRSRYVYHSISEGGFEAVPATVTVLNDVRKELLAVDVAGFYVPAGGKPLRSDDELWRALQSR